MNSPSVPVFAIVGHPNEGKSTVVSTLSEDDSVRISATPGETIKCRPFPVIIDDREIIRFVDTPGFQNPRQTLAWMQNYRGAGKAIVQSFCQAHADKTQFKDELELFQPIAQGAGIIYVADGSRPVRGNDRAEMEILRLTGLPRMAIINCKDPEESYLEDWKNEFAKHFNSIRVFNALSATYAERIDLLESLKSIHQDWQAAIAIVIKAFKKNWHQRNIRTAELISDMLTDCITHTVTRKTTDGSRAAAVKALMRDQYRKEIKKIEKKAHHKIKKIFKHNIFNLDLPAQSIVNADLFDTRTWQVLGLTPRQLATAAGIAGGTLGAVIDTAAAGLTFGIFTAIGGAVGAGSAFFGGRRMTSVEIVGLTLGGSQIRIGPNANIQFFYVLLDRALIYYAHVINWAHGRRDRPQFDNETAVNGTLKKSFSSTLDNRAEAICREFFKNIHGNKNNRIIQARKNLEGMILAQLEQISNLTV
ncbi:MAG: hypothetical protein B6I22_14365 [Desulfobacteraceae bacterium 4572_123]|nr:MAG: hypothetical protein B6I22_14365 [Desulfobacteraceae bacterium 4572_123]